MLYAYSAKEPIGELNLKRALDEDIGVFSSFLCISCKLIQPKLALPNKQGPFPSPQEMNLVKKVHIFKCELIRQVLL